MRSWRVCVLGVVVLMGMGIAGCDEGTRGDEDVMSDAADMSDTGDFVGSCDNDDHSDSVLNATSLRPGERMDAVMCSPSDADVFATGTLPQGTEITSVLVYPLDASGNPRLSVLKVTDSGGDVLRQSSGELNFVSVFHTAGEEAPHALEASVTGATEEMPYRLAYSRTSFQGGCQQDGREPNDSADLPSFIESGRTEAGVICENDIDVFEVGGLPGSGEVLVMASLIYDGAKNVGNYPEYKVLTLGLENAEGEPYTGEYIVTEFGPSYFFHRIDVSEPLYVAVKGYVDREEETPLVGINDYVLSVDVVEVDPCTDDAMEPDDRAGAAHALEAETPAVATLCGGDSDWWALGEQNLNFPIKNKMTVDLKNMPGVGATVWFEGTLEPDGPVMWLPAAFTTDDASTDKQIVFDIPLTGNYYLEVKGVDPSVEASGYEVSYAVELF